MPSHFITLAEAKELTSKFRKSKDNVLESKFKDKGILPVCETFSREAFDIVLAKPGCKGLRMYFAMDPVDTVKLIIVGVNENNEDMINIGEGKDEPSDIIDQGTRCPVTCPPPSPLNG